MQKVRAFLLDTSPTVRRWVLLAAVVGVPVLFLRTGRDPFNVPKLALLTVCVAFAGALRLAEALQGRSLAPMKRLLVPAAAIAGPLLIAWVFSAYKGWALFGRYGRFQGLIPYLIVIAFGLLLVDAFDGRSKHLAWGLVIAGSLVGLYAVVQWVGADPFIWGFPDRLTTQSLSTVGNSNFAGGFLAICLPLGVTLAMVDEGHRGRATRLTILIVLGLAATQTEGGWAAGLAGIATVVGIRLASRRRLARFLGPVVAALAVGALLAIGAYSIAKPENTLIPGSLQLRAWWWQEAAMTASDAPLFGTGPNTFTVEVWQHRILPEAVDNEYAATDDPHSVPLAFLTAGGALGLIGFLSVFVWVGREAYREDALDPLMAAFLGGVVAYLVQAFVSIDELTLRVALWTVLAGTVLAGLEARRRGQSKPKKKRREAAVKQSAPDVRLRAPAAVALLGVAAAAAVYWSVGLVLADRRFLLGEQLFAAGEPAEASRQYQLGLGFRDDYEIRHTYGFRIGDAGVSAEREEYIEESQRVFSYVWDFPDVAAIRDFARVMREWSQVDPEANEVAKRLYARARELDPVNPALQEEAANVLDD